MVHPSDDHELEHICPSSSAHKVMDLSQHNEHNQEGAGLTLTRSSSVRLPCIAARSSSLCTVLIL